MSNALKNSRDNDATGSLDTQAVLDDYMKTYGIGKVRHQLPLTCRLPQCQRPANSLAFWCFSDKQHPPAVNNLKSVVLLETNPSAASDHE